MSVMSQAKLLMILNSVNHFLQNTNDVTDKPKQGIHVCMHSSINFLKSKQFL